MKASVVIALIVMGGAVVVAPVAASYRLRASYHEHVAELLQKPGATSVNLMLEDLGDWETFGCWFTGTLMALAGIVLAFRGTSDDGAPNCPSPGGGD